MNGNEHRAIGDSAFGGALVNLGGDAAGQELWLGYGDLMALSGDFFKPEKLFSLARVRGHKASRLGTRDEIVCALKVMTVDEGFVDPRFEPGGMFADFRFSALAASSDVERHVRDRYLHLAATNDDHFVSPGGVTHERISRPFGSAVLAYRHHHQLALEEAWRLGRAHGELSQAMALEAAAQHFLTDAFTAGHLRTPVAQIRTFWRSRYPSFWENLKGLVASSTASALKELSWALRPLPARFLHDSTLSALELRTSRYPDLSFGDFLARLFHDWDNGHGLAVEGGGVIYGDGHVDQGDTRALALAAVRAGIEDVEAAFDLGLSARSYLSGESLYRAVRSATGAPESCFSAEMKVPRPSATNPAQNWRAPDIGSLWMAPIVGAGGTTVGEALVEMLEPDGQFIRQLGCLGQGHVEPHGLLAVPILGNWLGRKGCQAYHRGFVDPLAEHPRGAIFAAVQGEHDGGSRRRTSRQGLLPAMDERASRERIVPSPKTAPSHHPLLSIARKIA